MAGADLKFPPADNSDPQTALAIIAYQTAACSKEDPARYARFLEQCKIRYTVGSKPWMRPPETGNNTRFLEPVTTDDPKVKLANRNEMAPILDGEAARLIGSTSEPSITPSEQTTIVHRAAKKAKAVLDDILKRSRWVSIQGSHAKNAVDYGTSHYLAGIENDYGDMRTQPAMVHACSDPTCNWKMLQIGGEEQPGGGHRFGGEIGREMFQAGIGVSVSQPQDEEIFSTLHDCPECKAPIVPRRAKPGEEALGLDGQTDAFGADLMEEKPLPKVFVHEYPDLDVFPIGGGRVVHGYLPEVTMETIVEVSWLLERYEFAGEVDPMSLSELEELARYHPSGLEMWGFQGTGLSTDQKRWAVLRITLRQPFKDPANVDSPKNEPLGRIMISANKTVLMNDTLILEYKTKEGKKKLPRMKLFSFQNELQNQSIHGISVASRLLSPQEALDAMFSQFQWDMAENGSPTLALPFGANLEGQGDGMEQGDEDIGIPNPVVRFNGENGQPVVIGGKVTHQDWQVFTEGIVTHMQRTTGQSQLDQGKSVNGAPSASAQMYIGQRLDETRKPKGQRWAEHHEEVFSYMLDGVVAVYNEPRQFLTSGGVTKQALKEFTGADLLGQTRVEVTVKPSHDNEAFNRQALVEALPIPGLVDLSTERKRLKVAKLLGLADDANMEPNQQVKAAQDAFMNFIDPDRRIKPIAKKRTDNHVIFAQVMLEELRTPAGDPLTRFWNMHELATDGWYEQFEAMQMTEKKISQGLGAPAPTLVMDPTTGGLDTLAIAKQKEAYEKDQQVMAEIAKLPKNVQLRIEAIQLKMLEAYQEFAALDDLDKQDASALAVYLSCTEAHNWYEKEQQMALMPPPEATQTGGGPAAGPGAPAGPAGPATMAA